MRNKINWPAPSPPRLDAGIIITYQERDTRGLISANQRNLSFYQPCDQLSLSGWEVISSTMIIGLFTTSPSEFHQGRLKFNWQTKEWTILDTSVSLLLLSWLLIITPISTKQSARPPSLPRISVWDMILCIPDNYFYSPRLSDSLREITPGWLLDTGWTLHSAHWVRNRSHICDTETWHISLDTVTHHCY